MFRRLARSSEVAHRTAQDARTPAHVVTSDFSTATCRFVLECTCGARFDTNYIDEALEWHELHRELAPLADQLGAIA
jgi:hypothetical protein